MDAEELLRKADFAKNSTAHKDALRQALFGQVRELDLDELEQVTAASKAWYEQDKNPHN
ncbi:MAG: hypothetical protein IJQ25_10765 [Oscillibacter sp.]|nr:hypothetical protein [Oscillibacter sp.]